MFICNYKKIKWPQSTIKSTCLFYFAITLQSASKVLNDCKRAWQWRSKEIETQWNQMLDPAVSLAPSFSIHKYVCSSEPLSFQKWKISVDFLCHHRSSEMFQDSRCSWLKYCPEWKHQSPQWEKGWSCSSAISKILENSISPLWPNQNPKQQLFNIPQSEWDLTSTEIWWNFFRFCKTKLP